MVYLKWSKNDIANIDTIDGIQLLLTEVDSEGVVTREIGLGLNNEVLFKAPSASDFRGLFDNQIISIEDKSNEITKSQFEDFWEKKAEK